MGAPDYNEIRETEKRMKQAAHRLHVLAPEVGMAITIIDFNSRRCDAVLARYAVKHIKAGKTGKAATTLAMTEEAYDKEINDLMAQYQLAQATRKEYEVERISWDTARSLLARQRETLNTLPETEA